MRNPDFGWWYPPGAANDPNAPYNQEDPPCEVCGQWPDDCVCPECPVCGDYGNPVCYDGGIRCNMCGTRTAECGQCTQGCGWPSREVTPLPSHGLIRSFAQVALRAEAVAQWAAEAEAEDRYYAELYGKED